MFSESSDSGSIQGRIIDGFEILEKFAKGAFSEVYLARHLNTDNYVAAKVILLNKQSNSALTGILRELSVFMQIQHKNIAKLYRYSLVDDEILIFFMEYVSPGSLQKHIRYRGRMHEPDAKKIFIQLLSVLSYIHVHHFLAHRDIKLENILIDSELNVKLIDFGLCDSFYCNKLRSCVGTPGYMSPEVVLGNDYNEKCDVWSLGVVLYTMMTSHLPFTAQSDDYKFLMIEAKSLSNIENISPELQDIIKKMLSPALSERPTITQLISHPWVIGCIKPAKNVDPKPIMFYDINAYSDLLAFRRITTKPDMKLVKDCAQLGFTEEEVIEGLEKGLTNPATTTYFLLQSPCKEEQIAVSSKLPPLKQMKNKKKFRSLDVLVNFNFSKCKTKKYYPMNRPKLLKPVNKKTPRLI